MKKILLSLFLITASCFSFAASVSISNPDYTLSSGLVSGGSVTYPHLVTETDNVFGNTRFTAVGAQPFTASWDLTVSNTVNVIFQGFSTVSNWAVSVFDSSDNSIWTASDTTVSDAYTLSAGIYNVIISGTSALSSWSALFTAAVVSEVPLPAAVWLFGSALVTVFAMRRRAVKTLA